MDTKNTSEPVEIPYVEWFHFVAEGDVKGMQSLLGSGLEMEVLHPLRQTTALAEATRREQHDVVAFLLQHGAAPDFLCGTRATTPLHIAAQANNWKLLKLLLSHTDHCSRCDAQGKSLLHLVALSIIPTSEESHALHAAEILLAKGITIDALDNEGITALHYAVINDWEAMVELLLMRGANPNLRAAETGITPLIIAALEDNRSMARLLLHYGADATVRMENDMCALSIIPALRDDIPEPKNAEIVELDTTSIPASKRSTSES
jgi:ankyrin repeat protein